MTSCANTHYHVTQHITTSTPAHTYKNPQKRLKVSECPLATTQHTTCNTPLHIQKHAIHTQNTTPHTNTHHSTYKTHHPHTTHYLTRFKTPLQPTTKMHPKYNNNTLPVHIIKHTKYTPPYLKQQDTQHKT